MKLLSVAQAEDVAAMDKAVAEANRTEGTA